MSSKSTSTPPARSAFLPNGMSIKHWARTLIGHLFLFLSHVNLTPNPDGTQLRQNGRKAFSGYTARWLTACNRLSREQLNDRCCRMEFGFQVSRDLLPVKSPVLDENFAGLRARDDHSCEINPGDVAFQTLRVALRTHVGILRPDAQRFQKLI